MKLAELIANVNDGKMTVSEAVDIVETEKIHYAIKNYSPQSKAERPYWDMLTEWDKRQSTPVVEKEESKEIEKEGQLWETCKCGNEPVYMPLHLCAKCWPGVEIEKENNTYLELVSGQIFKDCDAKIVHMDRTDVVNVVSQSNDAGSAETYNDVVSIEAIEIMDVKVHAEPRIWTTPFIEGEDSYYEAEEQ